MLELFIKLKPDWLYEVMPIIFFVVGLSAIFYFDKLPGNGAGALLLSAAGLIWTMQKQH